LCWEHLLSRTELAAWRLLMPDLPGYGHTPGLDSGPLGLAAHADWLADWLHGAGAAPAVVLGHSMGGVVALLLAERHPEAVSAVIDVDGNKSPADCVFSARARAWDREGFAAGGFDKLRETIRRRGRRDPAQASYHRSLLLADAATYHLNSGELVEMSARQDMARRLAALPVPAVYVAGVPGGASPRTHELLETAGVEKIDIAPSGHWPFIDQPDAFCDTVRTWLQAVENGAGSA
jgi:pimeloyl-ACP methyl ester carboxylesterase